MSEIKMTIVGALTVILGLMISAGSAMAEKLPKGFNPKRHMTFEQVRPGMKGYGITVFHGTEPEPFPVEVVSVERGFAAGKAVVWVRCPSPRMQKTGPVQGMSGSPIFLWDKATEKGPDGLEKKRKIGTGGRMIGAFAFGFRMGKDCYVGIQPIQFMLAARNRVKDNPRSIQILTGTRSRDATFAGAYELARSIKLKDEDMWRLNAFAAIAGYKPPKPSVTIKPQASTKSVFNARTPLSIPVTVGSNEQARMLQPFLRPFGMSPTVMQGGGGRLRPTWIDPKKVKYKPGGVLAIPLVSGDLDMSGVGTTTEVLPDGTVLAFGHSMFAQGDIQVPMAPGYVHFIQPNLSASFKLGGALDIRGAILRDEAVAVVGKPKAKYKSVPVTVSVDWGDKTRNKTFKYQVAHHTRMLPSLIGSAITGSLSTDTEFPLLNTLHIEGLITFDNGKKLKVKRIIPSARPTQVMIAVATPINTIVETEFGVMGVKSIDAKVKVIPRLDAAIILGATLKSPTVKPGETATIVLRVQPYRKKVELREFKITIPKDTREGNYLLTIGGGSMYQQMNRLVKPHLSTASNSEELFEAVKFLVDIKDDSLYGVIRLRTGNNLTIGRSELPKLPTSRAALIRSVTSTRTGTYLDTIEKRMDLPYVVQGGTTMPIVVTDDPAAPK